MSEEGEFDFIARCLAPLSEGAPGAADLSDDGALVELDAGETLAVTTDTLIEGRHFPLDCDPALAARKALRVNLSDLAAMGARPFGYCLNITWPDSGAGARAGRFVEGLRADQDRFGVRLLGGDTTQGPGPWAIAVTALGRRPAGLSLRRAGARAGDALVATGTFGDAGLGLRALTGEVPGLEAQDSTWLKQRSLVPTPRLNAVPAMRRHARAAIDVSDGLLADARHLAVQSGLHLEIALEAMAVSAAARAWISTQDDEAVARLDLASSGDDYELLLASPRPDALLAELAAAGLEAGLIGRFSSGPGAVSVTWKSEPIKPETWGFTHF